MKQIKYPWQIISRYKGSDGTEFYPHKTIGDYAFCHESFEISDSLVHEQTQCLIPSEYQKFIVYGRHTPTNIRLTQSPLEKGPRFSYWFYIVPTKIEIDIIENT